MRSPMQAMSGMRLGIGHRRLDEAVVAQHELEVTGGPVEQFGGGVDGDQRQDRLILQARDRAQHSLEDQALLGSELSEEGDLVDAGFLGDPPGRCPAEPGDGKDLHCGFEELFADVHGWGAGSGRQRLYLIVTMKASDTCCTTECENSADACASTCIARILANKLRLRLGWTATSVQALTCDASRYDEG